MLTGIAKHGKRERQLGFPEKFLARADDRNDIFGDITVETG